MPEIDEPSEEDIITCWCGASGTYDVLFDDNCLEETCGGMGVIYCYCGGDFCVCHHHGEIQCEGCEDCEPDNEDDWDDCDYDD